MENQEQVEVQKNETKKAQLPETTILLTVLFVLIAVVVTGVVFCILK